MKFLELVKIRRSVRKYQKTAVEREKISRCLEAARLAPSACNSQPWHFVVVDDVAIVKPLAKTTYNNIVSFNKFVESAPVIIVIVMEKPKTIAQIGGRIKDKDFSLMDIGIAAEHFCLQATEEGLGTCMLGWFKEKEVMKLLGIPSNKRVGLLISLGYPDGEMKRDKNRKKAGEIVSYNKYKG